MGLDQYAYAAATQGQQAEYYDKGDWDEVNKQFISPINKPLELAYWRKHPNLQGWMESLWKRKMNDANKELPDDSVFNGIELELTTEDIDQLESDVLEGRLPATSGFFFGEDSDSYYQKEDLEFIKRARTELFCGLKVFYNSSW
jgi:hypothetical protein